MPNKEIRNEVLEKSNPVQQWLYCAGENGDLLYFIAQKYDLHKDEGYRTFATTVGDIILGFYRVEDTVPLLQQELGIDPRTAALLGADVLDFLAPLSDPNWQPPVEEGDDLEAETEEKEQTTDTANFPVDSIVNETPSVTPQIANPQPHKVPFPVDDNNTSPAPTAHEMPPTQPTHTPTTYQSVAEQEMPQPTVSQAKGHNPAPNPALHTMAEDMQQARQTTPPQSAPSLNLDHEPSYQAQSQDSLRQPLSNTPTYTPPPNTTPPPHTHDPEPPRWSST